MRSKKHALVKILITVGIRTDFRPDRRRRKTPCYFIDIFALANDISSRRGNTASRIFDQRADTNIGTVLRRFRGLHKLAITIIDKDAPGKTARADKGADFTNFPLAQRITPFITAGTLNKNDLNCPVGKPLEDCIRIKVAVLKLAFFEGNAKIGERTYILAVYHFLQGIVRVP